MTDGQGLTVLLADDDEDYRNQLALQLRQEGFTVLSADSRAAAEQLLESQAIDFAIVDVMMESWDAGFILCRSIKRRNPQTPVFLVTAVASETGIEFDAATAEERSWVKADAVFAKPVSMEQLRARLAQARRG